MGSREDVRIGPLTSIGRVGIEIARVYRKTRRKEIASADGMRLVQMLLGLKACHESTETERRLEQIEVALQTLLQTRPQLLTSQRVA
jgi:hypothetical protein